ncbi:hypothetical protein DX910_00465 [Acinetobacter haemolyticus]|nr:hypothetical protein DX910_00465 [Acinetobacter haemolyticus]
MRYFNPEVALRVQVPDYSGITNSIRDGMELGNQIKQHRQSGILSQLLAQNMGENGQPDLNKALQAVQSNPNQAYQPALVNTLSGLLKQQRAEELKAQQDAEKFKNDSAKTIAETEDKRLGNTQKGQTLLANLIATSTDATDAARKLATFGQQYGLPKDLIDSTLMDLKNLVDNNQGSPEAFQAMQKSFGLLGSDKPIEYMMPNANTVANNETAIKTTGMNNATTMRGQDITSETTMRGQDITAQTADKNRVQQLTIENARIKAQQEGGSVQVFGGNLYFIDKQGNATPVSHDTKGQPIKAQKSGVGALPTPALKIVTEAQSKVGEADLAITKLNKVLANVDLANLGPWNNLKSSGRNLAGFSNEQSQAYERVVSGLKDAANAILMAAKGVQTDGDAQRAERIVMASKSTDPDVVKNAVNDLIEFSEEIKLRHQNQIGGVYANYGLDPNEYFNNQGGSNTPPPPSPPNNPKGGMSFRANDVLKAAKARGITIQEMERIIKSSGGTIVK